MTALTDDLTLTGEIVLLDGPPVVGKFYHLDDEVIMVSGSVTLNYSDAVQHNRWRVRRAQDHTTAATHSSGAALTVAREFGSEAGGAGVPDPSGAPDGQTIVTVGEEYALGTSISTEDSVTGSTASVAVQAPEDDGSAEVSLQALAALDKDGSVHATAGAVEGAALARILANSASGSATARLDAASGTGDSESRLAVLDAAQTVVLAGVVARHVDGVGDSLDITDGNGVLGSEASPGSVLAADAAVGSAWTVVDPLTSATDIIIAAGIGMVTFGADGSVETGGSGVIRLLGLPTADPTVAGQLWNDAGTLKVSAG